MSNSLHDLFYKLMNEYGDEYSKAWGSLNFKSTFREIVSETIPDCIKRKVDLEDYYRVKGSYGTGRWAAVPWIAIFNTRITTSVQSGVFVVYLLNKDTKELFLILGQGVAGAKDKNDLSITTKALQSKFGTLSSIFNTDSIVTGNKGYDAGTIFSRKYTLKDLPDDAVLIDELKQYLDVYNEYFESIAGGEKNEHQDNNDAEWTPSLDEYHPGLYKDDWIGLLNDRSVFSFNNLRLIKMYLELDPAGCGRLAEHYGGTSNQYTTRTNNLCRRVVAKTGCNTLTEANVKYWPVLFQGRYEGKNFIYKLRDELKEALIEFDFSILNIEEMTNKDRVGKITKCINGKGYHYSESLIKNFYLSLKTKPFVILAGISGTGKSKLAEKFAEAIGAEFKLISVRPDWSDSTDLLGHLNLDGEFIPGELTNILYDANMNLSTPYIICLDEMNLARVEYYFSDFLSKIESIQTIDGVRKSGDMLDKSAFGKDEGAFEEYGSVHISDNVYIVGTVNMDETTFPFSKKVLDRANTIELSDVNLWLGLDEKHEEIEAPVANNAFLQREYSSFRACYDNNEESVGKVISLLEKINEVLIGINAQVAFRVRDEISFYVTAAEKNNLLTFNEAMDNAIMQKILPRVQGSSNDLETVFLDLFKIMVEDAGADSVEDYDTSSAVFKKSADKIKFMYRRLESDGYTSYWI